MPYANKEKLIPRIAGLDRRIKLTPEITADIKRLHANGIATRAIAREYDGVVSRRTIQFVIDPSKRAKVAKQFIQRRKDGRYKPTKEAWASIMREHRHYKQSLAKANKLI